ncbi:MAG TPA: LPS export ABC transporter permease LptF [Nitrospiraceae bacterium]|nr:LPS export ABC transporter permease LptF [Nitrospiraceae bacterium]
MIIQRSLLKELLINFSLILVILTLMLFMERLLRLTRLAMGEGADLLDLIKIFIYLQPSIMLLTIPMAILISVFLTYGRIMADSEMVILKGSGMSFWAISKPAFIISIAGFLISITFSLYLLPKSAQSFRQTVFEVVARKAAMVLEEGTFSTAFKDTVIFIKEKPSQDKLKGIFIYKEKDSPGGEQGRKEPVVIAAKEGALLSSPQDGLIELSMTDGIMHTFGKKTSSEVSFSRYSLVLMFMSQPSKEKRVREMEITKLWMGRKDNVSWNVELHRRFAIPFACLIFGFLGPALSLKTGKTGRLGGFSLSLFSLVLYYLMFILGEGLAKAGTVPTFISVWGPNLFFGIVAFLSFFKAHTERSLLSRKS